MNIAKRELQVMMETFEEMHFYLNLDFIGWEENELIRPLQKELKVDLGSKKIIRRLNRLCREKVSDIFGQGKFNFEVLDYAMQDYFKRKRQEEEQREQEQKEKNGELTKPSHSVAGRLLRHVFSFDFLLQVISNILLSSTS